jgi:acyl dehydratase
MIMIIRRSRARRQAMTTAQEPQQVDWIPKHLPEGIQQELLALTRESERMPSIECSETLIRHWCEATEDSNPLYLDREYAKSQGFSGVVAPPTMNMTFAIPYRWPRPNSNATGPTALHYRLKKLMSLPVGVVVDTETEYLRFVELGDRLFLSNRLASMTGPKKTRLGEGYFWVTEGIARNQNDEITSRTRTTMFAYSPGLTEEESDDDTPGILSKATEDALSAERCTHLPTDQSVYWDEVQEGDTLPTLMMPITVTRCIYLASATRDFSPHHSNSQYAQEQVKARDMFLNTPFNTGMMSRFATEWGGPRSRLRKVKLYMRENICAGDDMVIDGRIVKKYAEADDHLVDIDIQVSTQHGPAYTASVTLSLATSDESLDARSS